MSASPPIWGSQSHPCCRTKILRRCSAYTVETSCKQNGARSYYIGLISSELTQWSGGTHTGSSVWVFEDETKPAEQMSNMLCTSCCRAKLWVSSPHFNNCLVASLLDVTVPVVQCILCLTKKTVSVHDLNFKLRHTTVITSSSILSSSSKLGKICFQVCATAPSIQPVVPNGSS